jgi:hypothetical protein
MTDLDTAIFRVAGERSGTPFRPQPDFNRIFSPSRESTMTIRKGYAHWTAVKERRSPGLRSAGILAFRKSTEVYPLQPLTFRRRLPAGIHLGEDRDFHMPEEQAVPPSQPLYFKNYLGDFLLSAIV